MGIAHPRIVEVELGTGQKVRVKKWTMAQRDELKPKVIALLDEVSSLPGGYQAAMGTDLVSLFVLVEDKVIEIVRASVSLEELSADQWAAMDWGDAPNLAQAIWDLNVTGAGGLMGKVGAAIGTMIANALIAAGADKAGTTVDELRAPAEAKRSASTSTPSSSPQPKTPRPAVSQPSPAEATATPST